MSNLHDKEAFFKKAREIAEGLSKEQLIEYYMAELETCCEVEERLKVSKKTNTKIMDYAVDLEKQLAEKDKKALALFSALYDILEEQDTENVSSRIDYLTKQNNGAISDFYKEHKVLKQKLAESEKNVEFYQERYSNATTSAYGADLISKNIQSRLEEEIRKLKQQLAEKEKEIISLECVISEIQNDIKELHEFKVGEYEYDLTDSDARFSLECELLNKDQDKISFAVEQLELVKELAHNHIKEIANDLSEEDDERLNQKHTIHGLATAITDIDKQIKTLRGEK